MISERRTEVVPLVELLVAADGPERWRVWFLALLFDRLEVMTAKNMEREASSGEKQ